MKSLKTLSDQDLLNRLSKLVKQEQNLTLEILPHLIEVENRKIFRALGHSSMFVYCTDGLGYSESSANRRICAARAIRKCPKAYDDLREVRVNLGTLALVWQHLNPALLEEIQGKSYRQVQAIVSRFNPMIKHRDITRPVTVRKPVQEASESRPVRASSSGSGGLAPAVEPGSSPELGEISLRRGGRKSATNMLPVSSRGKPRIDASGSPEPQALKTETVKMHQMNCLVEDQVMQSLDRCKELLSGRHPRGIDYNTLMMELASDWLERHDPVRRNLRRKKQTKGKSPNKANKTNKLVRHESSRYISQNTRDAVFSRDGGQCTYVGRNGKRCESKWDLEIHHDVTPFAMGGDHSLRNLRLLCAAHNKHEAERVYGRRDMDQFTKQQE